MSKNIDYEKRAKELAQDNIKLMDKNRLINWENKDLKKQLSLCSVTPRFSDKELAEMCNKMLYQIRGNFIEEHEQCEVQGHPDWQIAMSYFRKLNEG